MKCIRCGIEIDDSNVFCPNCGKALKKESSRREVNELEREIEANKLLNEDENTKELTDLESLVEEDNNQYEAPNIDENVEVRDGDTQIIDNKVEETRVSRNKDKKSKKKNMIIIALICIVGLIGIVFIILSLNEPHEEEIKLDYEKILSRYGKKVENRLSNYETIPEWGELTKNIEYGYVIDCEIHEIYENKKVYLDTCTVDNESVKYSYGTKQTEIEKSSVSVYRSNNKYNASEGELVGTITCDEGACEYVRAFDDYVIIKEKSLYYLYNYTNNTIVFGPFNDVTNLIYLNNNLYGIYYTEGNKKNVYSLLSNKKIENVDGRVVLEADNFDPTIMYKYDYVILNNKKYSFLNLKTGKVAYTIDDNILKLEEDSNNNIVYILTYKKDVNTFKVINSHGKELFDKEINYFKLMEDTIVISDKNSFEVYDLKLNKKVSSKTYDSIVSMYDDSAIVIDGSLLKLVDLEDNILGEFDIGINSKVDKDKSGWKTVAGEKLLYIYIKNSNEVLVYSPTTGEMQHREIIN